MHVTESAAVDTPEHAVNNPTPDIRPGEWVELLGRIRFGTVRIGKGRRGLSATVIKLVGHRLAAYADYDDGTNVRPGLARLAVDLELDHTTVKMAVAYLRRLGLITVVRHRSRARVSEYRLTLPEDLLDRDELDVWSPSRHRLEIERVAAQQRPKPKAEPSQGQRAPVVDVQAEPSQVHGAPVVPVDNPPSQGQRAPVVDVQAEPSQVHGAPVVDGSQVHGAPASQVHGAPAYHPVPPTYFGPPTPTDDARTAVTVARAHAREAARSGIGRRGLRGADAIAAAAARCAQRAAAYRATLERGAAEGSSGESGVGDGQHQSVA